MAGGGPVTVQVVVGSLSQEVGAPGQVGEVVERAVCVAWELACVGPSQSHRRG